MPDMLVKLYDLPRAAPMIARQAQAGIVIRRALAPERRAICEWVMEHFGQRWVDQCGRTFRAGAPTTFIAVEGDSVLGFSCYDTTARGVFGPMGTLESRRGQGIGSALLVATLVAMKEEGYAYGIIGQVGPADFYSKAVGATLIEDSDPGMYTGILFEEGVSRG